MRVQSAKTFGAKPAHRRLSEYLRSQIEAGDLTAGDKLPSYEQLAAQFDTHKVAVKRALVDLETDGLIESRPRSGTYVSRGTVSRRVLQIALASDEAPETINESYWLRMLQGMREAECSERSHVVLLDKKRKIDFHFFDGILYNTGIPNNHPAEVPCVILGGVERGYNSVSTDDFEAGRLAAEHLIALGHRRIAYLAYHHGPIVSRRRAGIQYALDLAGIVHEPSWFRQIQYSLPTDEPGTANLVRYEMRGWLNDGWAETGCTAILAQNDLHAIGIYRALEEAGLSVPGDVSVVGFDDLIESQMLSPALTTIHVPLQKIGEIGLNRLTSIIESVDRAGETVGMLLDPKLVVRESTRPPRR